MFLRQNVTLDGTTFPLGMAPSLLANIRLGF